VPKVFGREMPTWMLLSAVAVLGYLVYGALFPDETPAASTTKKAVTTKKKADDPYDTPADHTARFAVFTETPKNAFKPLYSKNMLGPATAKGIQGEPNWGYTGYVVTNGRVQALLENSSTGEGDYVGVGDMWKGNKIISINAETLTMSGGEGGPQTVKIGDTSEPMGKQGVVANAGGSPANIAPVNPLAGPIGAGGPGFAGGQFQIDPSQPAAPIAIDGVQAQPGQGFGGGGGRRRGRRGNGGGNAGGN